MENIKKEIVKINLDLSANEIKKKLRRLDPNVNNEEAEKLILEVLKELNYQKKIAQIKRNKKSKQNLNIQKQEDDMER